MYLSFLRPLPAARLSTLRAFISTTTAPSTKAIPIIPLVTSSQATKTVSPASGPIDASTLPYIVQRTRSGQYPIYPLRKRGGNLLQTLIRKTSGDVSRLRQDVQDYLGLEKNEVVVNSLTKHIVVRGHRKAQLMTFLRERNF